MFFIEKLVQEKSVPLIKAFDEKFKDLRTDILDELISVTKSLSIYQTKISTKLLNYLNRLYSKIKSNNELKKDNSKYKSRLHFLLFQTKSVYQIIYSTRAANYMRFSSIEVLRREVIDNNSFVSAFVKQLKPMDDCRESYQNELTLDEFNMENVSFSKKESPEKLFSLPTFYENLLPTVTINFQSHFDSDNTIFEFPNANCNRDKIFSMTMEELFENLKKVVNKNLKEAFF